MRHNHSLIQHTYVGPKRGEPPDLTRPACLPSLAAVIAVRPDSTHTR